LRIPGAIEKHREASVVVGKAVSAIIKETVPGKLILDLCNLGDRIINEEVAKKYNKAKIEKGIAFPTSISVNNVVGHYSPLSTDKTTIKEGDVVKIDLGAHFDGYIAVAAHTVIARSNHDEPVTGRKADVICAAHFASQVAKSLLKPGNKNSDITEAIQLAVADFNCTLVEGVLSHQLRRFIIDGNKVIINRPSIDQKVEEFSFEPYEAYAIDIIVSTGEGKTKQTDARTTIFKRAVDQNYFLKLKASRAVLNDINQKFTTMPFTLRAFPDQNKARLGMTELINHNLVHSYPVLYEKDGEYVAQIKFTAIIQPKSTLKFNDFDVPYVQSELSLQNTKVQDILSGKKEAAVASKDQTSEAAKKKKKKPKKKADNTTTTTTSTSTAETSENQPQPEAAEAPKPEEASQ